MLRIKEDVYPGKEKQLCYPFCLHLKQQRIPRVPLLIAALISIVLLIQVNLPESHAAGASYYVAPTGSDSSVGTLSAPFATIQKCASVATGGDICFIIFRGSSGVGNIQWLQFA